MSDYQWDNVRTDLFTLYDAAAHLGGWNKAHANQHIRVGEYPLALDSIAYAYLNNEIRMPADQFAMFEELAAVMELENDPEYDGVARLRAQAKDIPG